MNIDYKIFENLKLCKKPYTSDVFYKKNAIN